MIRQRATHGGCPLASYTFGLIVPCEVYWGHDISYGDVDGKLDSVNAEGVVT